MVRLLPLALAVTVLAAPAQAEDFNGFYAGVNGGYGWSRQGESTTGAVAVPDVAPGKAATSPGLPPSASAAAAGLHRGAGSRTRGSEMR